MRYSLSLTMAAASVLAAGAFSAGTMASAAQTMPQPLTCTSADAVSLAPMGASTVALGAYTGVAYYTVEDAGYQVVATIAPGEDGAPIRFVSTLADGQKVVL